MKPTYGQIVQLNRNWVELTAKLDHEKAKRLNENFDIVYGIAKGEVKRTAPVLLKSVVYGVSISEAPAVKTADCFKFGDSVYAYRDLDFDRWLPKKISAVGAGMASTLELAVPLTFQEMAEAHLGINGSPDKLKKALIAQGKCWGPKQIDELIRNCEKGDNPLKLRTDGYANLFFIEVNGIVFAVFAYRHLGGWHVDVGAFANARRWNVGLRVSFRN